MNQEQVYAVGLPLSVLVEPEGFGEGDFFAEADNEYENEQVMEEGINEPTN